MRSAGEWSLPQQVFTRVMARENTYTYEKVVSQQEWTESVREVWLEVQVGICLKAGLRKGGYSEC